MIIQSYESSKRADSCMEYLRGAECTQAVGRIVLLPIPTTRDKRTILNTKVYINDVLETLDGGTVVSGYGLDDGFITAARERGALVLDLSADEEFLLDNAYLTALATLGILLSSDTRAPREIRIGVVGYGRIGKHLTNMLLYLGSDVRVFTSRGNMRLLLGECGVLSSESSSSSDLTELDILINTAPAEIFTRDSIPDGLRVIDLASGDNFPGIEGVERYPSIPAKMFPESAGRTWGRAIERFIECESLS